MQQLEKKDNLKLNEISLNILNEVFYFNKGENLNLNDEDDYNKEEERKVMRNFQVKMNQVKLQKIIIIIFQVIYLKIKKLKKSKNNDITDIYDLTINEPKKLLKFKKQIVFALFY